MIKKNEKKIKEIKIQCDKLYNIENNAQITPSLAIMINNYLDKKAMAEHNDFEYRKIIYLHNMRENSLKKQYNNLIIDLYQKGKIIINSEECDLKNLYILFQKNDKNYFLTYSKSTYTDFIQKSFKAYPYDTAIKFIDSTAFIALINNPSININNNTIIVNNKEILLDLINNWDGQLHDKIWNTESIINKKTLEDD